MAELKPGSKTVVLSVVDCQALVSAVAIAVASYERSRDRAGQAAAVVEAFRQALVEVREAAAKL